MSWGGRSYRRVEGYRRLRSDGKPNFSNRVYRIEKDLEILAKKPAVTVAQTTPFIEAVEKMYKNRIRSLVVTDGGRYTGMLLVEDVMSYLGGGELYNLVIERLENDLHKVINEPINSIMERNYPSITMDAKLTDVISLMISECLKIIPVLRRDGRVYGIISEHDIVEMLAEKRTGVKAKEVMTQIVSIDSEAPLLEALSIMTRTGLRRIFIKNEMGQIIGVFTAAKVIEYYGSHKAFKYVEKGYLEDTTMIELKKIGWQRVHTVNPNDDVGEVVVKILDEDVGVVLVTDDSKPLGMIGEREVFYALATPIKP